MHTAYLHSTPTYVVPSTVAKSVSSPPDNHSTRYLLIHSSSAPSCLHHPGPSVRKHREASCGVSVIYFILLQIKPSAQEYTNGIVNVCITRSVGFLEHIHDTIGTQLARYRHASPRPLISSSISQSTLLANEPSVLQASDGPNPCQMSANARQPHAKCMVCPSAGPDQEGHIVHPTR